MQFPKNATKEEQEIYWKKLVEISDQDFGFLETAYKRGKNRFCARVVLKNEQGEICVINNKKVVYPQLPGGGIEEDENITEALCRETREESGFLIKDVRPLGYTLEKRENARHEYKYKSISFFFSATATKFVGTDYTDGEKSDGFFATWLPLAEAISEFIKYEGLTDDYAYAFVNRRDLAALKEYQKTLVTNS